MNDVYNATRWCFFFIPYVYCVMKLFRCGNGATERARQAGERVIVFDDIYYV